MYLLLANGITCFTDHKFLECILFVLIYIICWLNYIFNLLTFTLILLIQAYNQGIYFDGWCLYLRNLFIYYQPVKYWREVARGFCYAEDWYILPSKMHTFRLDLVYSFFFSLSSISLIFLLFPVFFLSLLNLLALFLDDCVSLCHILINYIITKVIVDMQQGIWCWNFSPEILMISWPSIRRLAGFVKSLLWLKMSF